ncbi:hypothetical protein Barb6_02979 [Bacteroidales bacterium Barb6]|nr:hypothetical protein Barb6_02979 [Bacteroidales bacterium Barb6]
MKRSGMWGLRIRYTRKDLKERYKLQTMIDNVTYKLFGRPFRTSPDGAALNPTFRFASCGAEIRHSFGICVITL